MSKPDNDYLWDRSGPVDPEIARLEALLAPAAHQARAPLDELRLRRRRVAPWIAAGTALVAAAGIVLYLAGRRSAGCSGDDGFAFTGTGGAVACGGSEVSAGVLPVGGVLDTGSHEAELAIAGIGRAELGTQTRVRLDRASTVRQQLYLERGHLHARVSAPPRMFAVATPSTSVVDLGCEYTIDSDDSGAGSLHVESGRVELEAAPGRIVIAPAGTHVHLLAGHRPSLPVVDRASPELLAAVEAYEHTEAEAIDRILAAATPFDSITLANLAVLEPGHAPAIIHRLAAVVPAVEVLSLDGVIADPVLYQLLLDELARGSDDK